MQPLPSHPPWCGRGSDGRLGPITHLLWLLGRSGTTSSLSFLSRITKVAVHPLTNVHRHLGGGGGLGSMQGPGTGHPISLGETLPFLLPSRISGEGSQSQTLPLTPKQAGPIREKQQSRLHPEARALYPLSLAWTPIPLSSLTQGSPYPHRLHRWHHGPGPGSRQGAWTRRLCRPQLRDRVQQEPRGFSGCYPPRSRLRLLEGCWAWPGILFNSEVPP